ncbi:Uncharacterised protein [Halioglobus japonicus]|nr:Uncharacterised protein [Halioglobus japonicus]
MMLLPCRKFSTATCNASIPNQRSPKDQLWSLCADMLTELSQLALQMTPVSAGQKKAALLERGLECPWREIT